MGHFETLLRNHDWSFNYSDDARMWKSGEKTLAALKAEHQRLQCPFPLGEHLSGGLYSWVHDLVVEKFYETEPDKWYRTGCPYGPKIMAAHRRKDLLTQKEFDAITQWLRENDS